MIPSVEECYKLMDKYGMLDNIKAHSAIVEKVAVIIAKGLIEVGSDLSLEKVIAGALLHDIGKTMCLNTNINHAPKGKEICLPLPLEIAGHDPYPVEFQIAHLETRPQTDINTAAGTGVMMVGDLKTAVSKCDDDTASLENT